MQHLQEREEKIKTIQKLSSSPLPSDLRSFRKTQNFRFDGGNKELSIARPHLCPLPPCKFHKRTVDADVFQTKDRLKIYSYEKLLKTARDINLVPEYARPTKTELIEYLAESSIVRSN